MHKFWQNLFNSGKPLIDEQHGLIESPPDSRDRLLSGIMPEIKRYPESIPRPFDLTIFNQGSSPSCVGWSGAATKQYLEMREREFTLPDGEWLYKECKKIDGMPNVKGTFFRAVLSVLKNVGCKLQGVDNDPSIYRIKEYRRVDDLSFEGLKKDIFVFGHALAGWRGSNAGWSGEVLRAPRAGEATWGHATALTHYYKDYLGGQNSWGEARHNKGLFKSPKDYLPFEAWVVVLDALNEPQADVKRGWVALTYVVNGETLYNLNVRTGPGLSYERITTLPKGTKVNFYGTPSIREGNHIWGEIVL